MVSQSQSLSISISTSGTGSDPSEELAIKFAEPIDVATKLLYDLDQKILEILKQQQQQHEKDSKPTVLTGKNAVDSKEPDSNIAALLSNLTDLDKKLTVGQCVDDYNSLWI